MIIYHLESLEVSSATVQM